MENQTKSKVEKAANICGILDKITMSDLEEGKVKVEREGGLNLGFLGALQQQELLGYVKSETTIVVWDL
jgi:hypothetical protein